MAASFVTNQKYGIIGFPANREINKQICHLGHGHLLLLGYLGTAKPCQHLTGTLNLVGNSLAASKPKSSRLISLVKLIGFPLPAHPKPVYLLLKPEEETV